MKKNKLCSICGQGKILHVADFGHLPIAHHLKQSPESKEYCHPLTIQVCDHCGIAKIAEPCPPEKLYLEYNYNFSSWKPEPHRSEEMEMILTGLGRAPESVFEIGSNDGTFLSLFDEKETRTRIGLEPNPFPARKAEEKGLIVINEFLNIDAVKQTVDRNGKFDLVVSRQVLEHLQDFELFFQCIDLLLSDNGRVFIDVPDSENGFNQGDASILWDEHVTYFCDVSLEKLFYDHGFELLVVKKFNFSGGILSCLFKRRTEKASGPDHSSLSVFIGSALAYGEKIEAYKKSLCQLILGCKKEHYAIIQYGVGCRGAMFVNGLGIGHLLDLAVDDQPERHGKYLPGTQIRIFGSEKLKTHEKALVILTVSQENDEKVKNRLNALINTDQCIILCACSPAHLTGEIEQAMLKLNSEQ